MCVWVEFVWCVCVLLCACVCARVCLLGEAHERGAPSPGPVTAPGGHRKQRCAGGVVLCGLTSDKHGGEWRNAARAQRFGLRAC